MTVRLQFQEQRCLPHRTALKGLRWAEYVLLFVGLISVDLSIWVNVETTFGQAYDEWTLDRQIAGANASYLEFLKEEIGLGRAEGSGSADLEATARKNKPTVATHLEPDTLIGRIDIPRLGLRTTVREGVADNILRRAAGHVPSTALPGQTGNVAVAAHRDTLFRKIRDIRKNDRITLETLNGVYDYRVESLKIVDPSDVSVLRASPHEQVLTLITCYPFNYIGSAPERFVVRARQVNLTARSQPPIERSRSGF